MKIDVNNTFYTLEWAHKNFALEALITEAGISLEEAKAMKPKDLMDKLGITTFPKATRVDLIVKNEDVAYMKVHSVNLTKAPSERRVSQIKAGLVAAFPGKGNRDVRQFFVNKWRNDFTPESKEECRKHTLQQFLNEAFPTDGEKRDENRAVRATFWRTYFGRKAEKPSYKQLKRQLEETRLLTKTETV